MGRGRTCNADPGSISVGASLSNQELSQTSDNSMMAGSSIDDMEAETKVAEEALVSLGRNIPGCTCNLPLE